MDTRVVKRARELALPEAIQPRHLVLAALELDPSIVDDLRRGGIDPSAVAKGAATSAPWDASDELAVTQEVERGMREFGADAASRRKRFDEMKQQAIARGASPDDPRFAIDPEQIAQQTFRESARRSIVGDKHGDRVATAGTERLLSVVRSRLEGAGIRESDPAAGDRLHARAIVATLIPVALAYSGRCDPRRAAAALLGSSANAFLEGRARAAGGFRGSLMHFEETQIERDRHLRPRHLLVAALRTVADRAKLPALTEIDWDALRRRLGYVTIVPPDSQERWGITHSEPAVMEAIAAANEAATRSHQPTCDVPLQWAVAAVAALARDERTREFTAQSGAPLADVEAVRCGCLAAAPSGTKTVAAATDEDVVPPRFRILWAKEAEIDGASVLQLRHVIVAALRCLPAFAQELTKSGALARLRAALRAARADEAPHGHMTPAALARSVLDGLVRSNTLRGFAWWPGMAAAEAEAVDAAIFLDAALRDSALRDAVHACGLDEQRVRTAIEVWSRGTASIS